MQIRQLPDSFLSAPTLYKNKGSDSSTTKSAVDTGELTIRNQEEQTQNINDLSRDTENANNQLDQLFDKEKEQNKLDALELVKDIAAQAKEIANNYDTIEKQKDPNRDKNDNLGGIGSDFNQGIDASISIITSIIQVTSLGDLQVPVRRILPLRSKTTLEI